MCVECFILDSPQSLCAHEVLPGALLPELSEGLFIEMAVL